MKKTPILISILILNFYACIKPPCQCEPITMDYLQCKILNSQWQNLIFGPQRIYLIDSIGVLKHRNNLSVHNASVNRSYADSSALRLDFYVHEAKSFIHYSQQTPNDSLEITWVDKKGKCCGEPYTFHEIGAVKFNGVAIQQQNGIFHFIK